MPNSRTADLVVLVVLALTPGLASASIIVSPVGVVDNELGEFDFRFDIGNVIDQSGLSTGFTSGATDFDTYLAGNPTADNVPATDKVWFSQTGTTTGNIDFDLGSNLTIEQLVLWNRGTSSTEQLNGFTLLTSTDPGFSNPTNVGSFNAANQSSGDAVPHELFDIIDSTGRYVRLQVTSNYGNTNLTTFGELAFDVSAVPEPSTFAMISLGLAGLAGYGWLKRQSSVS